MSIYTDTTELKKIFDNNVITPLLPVDPGKRTHMGVTGCPKCGAPASKVEKFTGLANTAGLASLQCTNCRNMWFRDL